MNLKKPSHLFLTSPTMVLGYPHPATTTTTIIPFPPRPFPRQAELVLTSHPDLGLRQQLHGTPGNSPPSLKLLVGLYGS